MAAPRVWLFDLDDTLHDATKAAFDGIREGMTTYIERELGLPRAEADALRRGYWQRYGATLLGLVRHHAVDAHHFLHHAHLLPGLEDRVRGRRADFAALARLPGRRYVLTNSPANYAARVLGALGIGHCFDGVIAVEAMAMFGHFRPKPDARMLRHVAVRLGVKPAHCVLVEDTRGHLKAARRIGMGTVWMQHFLRGAAAAAGRAPSRSRPAYVDRRIRRLRELESRPARGG